jgi:hypothetical protein
MLWIIIASLALLASCATSKERTTAEALALRVHEYMRAANFAAIYEESERRFKTVGTESEFVSSMRGLEEQLGSFKHAEAIGYEVKFDSRLGKMHQLYFALEYEHGRATENLIVVRSGSGKMELWALEIEPEAQR